MFEIEPNDSILLANFIEIDDSSVEVISGEIGDTFAPANDVDLFGIELNPGETLFADINAAINGSTLDSVITIFDVDGNLLVQNEDNLFNVDDELVTEDDPFQQFTATQAGIYYVGVSGAGNLSYDPNIAGSGTGESVGAYSLVLTVDTSFADDNAAEPNDVISFANPIELNSEEPVVVSGEIGDNAISLFPGNDVDLFEVTLAAGDNIFADVNAEIIGSPLDAVLTVFDVNGVVLAQSDNNIFEIEDEIIEEDDPFVQFVAPIDGDYYFGVSSSGNIGYNPNVIGSGIGDSSGFYSLSFSVGDDILDDGIVEVIPDDDILDDGLEIILDNGVDDRNLDDISIGDEVINRLGDIIPTDSELTL
ncbi:putative pre-peptidase [Xenococcus sp. PCC 7305]|uniref:pre-peptidase C-terminal domain-containing protein n=1 Tax=Xenococcus sp. PCC 7305 TaxID=102125 RepID=UPI0002AC1FCF|nr:pre-peptidase C-terminal domain-containing protein [Xenococcus sp. PCC 7305]ELS02031.1 putative pre-peptidase [Xenococcus sp. PCC 7305]